MKRILFVTLLLLGFMNADAQQGYWVEGNFVGLIPDESCTFRYVQAMDEASQKALNDLYASVSETADSPIWKMAEGRFLVLKDYALPSGNYYESAIYNTPGGDIVIVLPRIVVSMEEESRIDDLLGRLGDKFAVDSSDRNRYVLSCQTRQSSDVLNAIQSIHDYMTEFGGIVYFEPEMYLPFSLSWTTGISGLERVSTGVDSHYSLDGRRLSPTAKGVHLVRRADGSVRKVIVK